MHIPRSGVILKKHLKIKVLSHFFLVILVLNVSTVIPKAEWKCHCEEHTKKMAPCCNSPKCVPKKEGFLLYCHLSGFGHDAKSNGPIMKRLGFTCDHGRVVLHLPHDRSFLMNQQSDFFSFFPLYVFSFERLTLELNDLVPPDDRPG